MRKILLVMSVFTTCATAQVYRVDPTSTFTTNGTTPPGANAPIFAVPGSSIALCSNASCATPGVSYSDASGTTACPSYAPVTRPGSNVCIQASGPLGEFGFWVAPGTYYYTVTFPNGRRYGPKPFSIGGGGSGGGGSMTWPAAAGVSVYSGSNAWGTSLTVGTAPNNLVQLNGSSQLPAVSAALLSNFPALNQNTTGNAATATAFATLPAKCPAGSYNLGVDVNGNAQGCTPIPAGAFSPLTGDVTSSPTGGPSVVRWPELSAYQLPTPAVLDGVTDDSAAFNSVVAGTTILVPQGKTARVTNLVLADNVTIRCGAGAILWKVAGSTTSNMFNLSGTNQTVQGCILDGNAIVQTTAQLYLVFINNATNANFIDNTLRNTGVPSNLMGGILVMNSTGSIFRNQMNSSVAGAQVKIDTRPGKSFKVLQNTLSGSQANAIQITNSNGGYTSYSTIADTEVAYNTITAVTDGFFSNGPTGNAIIVFQADATRIHDNYIKNVRFSAVRVNNSAAVNIGFNYMDGAQETTVYCEYGSVMCNVHDNTIVNFVSGINFTNVASRSPDQVNSALNNVLMNGTSYGIKIEHDIARGNIVDSVPFCYLMGFGATTHDNTMDANTCTHDNAAFTPVVAAVGVDTALSAAGFDQINGLTFSGTTVAPGAFPTNLGASIHITAITQATNGVVTFNSGTQPAGGVDTVCFYGIGGMTQINGLCPTVVSSTATTATLNLNTTAFSAFVAPTGGQFASGTIIYSGGTTPKYALPVSLAFVRVDPASKALTSPGGFRSAGTTNGALQLTGIGSSLGVTQTVNTATSAWQFTWPTTAGSAGQFMQTDGAGVGSWQVVPWGSIGGTLSSQADISAALALKANATSPVFTGPITTSIAGSVQCVHANAAGVLTGTGADCGAGGGGANSAGFYLTNQATNAPANAINLGLLASGLLKQSVTAGVATLANAVAGTDYQAPITGAPGTWLAESQITNLTTDLAAKVPTTRMVAGKALSVDVALVKADVGLGSVDNTADASKPVSTAQATALALKANLAGANFTAPISVGITVIADTLNNQIGTAYTLLAADNGRIVTLSNASPIVLTVPAGLPIGFSCLIVQLGVGAITPTFSGTTILQRASLTKTAGQYAVATLLSHAANIFVLAGDLQ